jgi:hypothetical protein
VNNQLYGIGSAVHRSFISCGVCQQITFIDAYRAPLVTATGGVAQPAPAGARLRTFMSTLRRD